MNRRIICFFGLVAVLSGSPLAIAHDVGNLSLEELLKVEVEGASRHAQPLSETPSTVTVISAEDIRRFGFRNLGEALQTARGVYLSRDRAYTYLGIRGFGRPGDYTSRVVLLQDGVRANDPVYDQGMVGQESPVEMDWLKRLEFVPGPSSASYGGNALFGIVNAVYWSGADLAGSRLTFDVGSGRQQRVGFLSGGVSAAGVDWVAGVSRYGRRGDHLYYREFDNPATSNGLVHHLDGERYTKGLFKAARGDWQVSLNYAARRKDVPTAYYNTSFDVPGNFNDDQQMHLTLGHGKALDEHWSQQLRLHLGQYHYDADYRMPNLLSRDETNARWWELDYQLHYAGWQHHRLLFGVEVREVNRIQQRYFDVEPANAHFDESHGKRALGLYVQDVWRLRPDWLLNLGARLDSQPGEPTMSSPRLALIHHLNPDTTLKYLYGRAFRTANDYERHYHDGMQTQKPNPDLKPERIESQELAVDLMLTPALRLGFGRYRYTLRDLIDQITDNDGLQVFRNQDTMRAEGWETELEAIVGDGWRARASLAWQRVRQASGTAVNSPQRLGKLLLDGPLPWVGWTLGLNLQAMGERTGLRTRVPGYIVGNLLLRRELDARAGAVSLGVQNLTGQRHFDPGAREHIQDLLPGDGRQLWLRWEIGF